MAQTTTKLHSILASSDRDYLLRPDTTHLAISDLRPTILGLYFSAHWCGPCRRFTPKLADFYGEINAANPSAFEVVFVSGDEDDNAFKDYFASMPWLAVPFADNATRDRLNEEYKVEGIPHLVLLDGVTGEVVCEDAVGAVGEYGSEGFPFTAERLRELEEKMEEEKRNQTVRSVLGSASRDFVVSGDGRQVPISELEGKMVGIYISGTQFSSCSEFTRILVKMYSELKKKGELFEVVLVSLDREESSFKEGLKAMPWLALPFQDKVCEKLLRYFELCKLPTLVILGPDGKTVHKDVSELVEEHGIEAYPFSPERIVELEEIEKKRQESQTLESLLVSDELDYVLSKDYTKVPVAQLVGKTVLIYFSAHWCPPCQAFTPKLAEVYQEIKKKHEEFEIVFASSDQDEESFKSYYSEMPWLALPFGDERKKSLSSKFKVRGIPTLVAIAPSGRTLTTEARESVMEYGSDSYPFTPERLHELAGEVMETDPVEIPENKTEQTPGNEEEGSSNDKQGFVCDGDVCRKA